MFILTITEALTRLGLKWPAPSTTLEARQAVLVRAGSGCLYPATCMNEAAAYCWTKGNNMKTCGYSERVEVSSVPVPKVVEGKIVKKSFTENRSVLPHFVSDFNAPNIRMLQVHENNKDFEGCQASVSHFLRQMPEVSAEVGLDFSIKLNKPQDFIKVAEAPTADSEPGTKEKLIQI